MMLCHSITYNSLSAINLLDEEPQVDNQPLEIGKVERGLASCKSDACGDRNTPEQKSYVIRIVTRHGDLDRFSPATWGSLTFIVTQPPSILFLLGPIHPTLLVIIIRSSLTVGKRHLDCNQ